LHNGLAGTSQLFLIRKGDMFGYADSKGNIVISPQWELAEEFRGNKAAKVGIVVDGDTMYGIIDTRGNYMVQPIYTHIISGESGLYFGGEDGYYYIWDSATDCSGFYDIRHGHFTPPQWRDAFVWTRGEGNLVPVQQYHDETWGFVDSTKGELVIPCRYIEAWPFREGVSVCTKEKEGEMVSCIVDPLGNEILLKDGLLIRSDDFYNGLAAVSDAQGKFGYVDKEGTVVAPLLFDFARFEEGKSEVLVGDEWYILSLAEDRNTICIKRKMD
jgi:hypothetical protein